MPARTIAETTSASMTSMRVKPLSLILRLREDRFIVALWTARAESSRQPKYSYAPNSLVPERQKSPQPIAGVLHFGSDLCPKDHCAKSNENRECLAGRCRFVLSHSNSW